MKFLLVAATLVLGSITSAGAVDLSQQFTDVDGHRHVSDELDPNVSAVCDGKKGGECLTLGQAVYHALLRPFPDEPNLSGEEKFKRGQLAMKLLGKKEYALGPQDVILLKTVIGKLYSPLIVVQAFRMLDPSLRDDAK